MSNYTYCKGLTHLSSVCVIDMASASIHMKPVSVITYVLIKSTQGRTFKATWACTQSHVSH